MYRLLPALFALWIGLAAAHAADPVFPPGERIGLVPPPDMTESHVFAGFEDADRHSAISLVELPLPAYEQVEKSIFENLPPGLVVEKREMLPFADGIGFLLIGHIVVNDVMMHRWYLLGRAIAGRNTDFGAFVTVNVPDAALKHYSDQVVRAALSTVTLRPPPVAEQVKLLPFKLTDYAGFRPIQGMPGGLIITDGPTDDINRQPYMIVSVGPGNQPKAEDRAKIAQEMLSTAPLAGLTVTATEAMRISNLPGFEIRANARNIRGEPVKLVQWIRFGASGYMRIIGVVPAQEWDEYFNRFRAVRDGIEAR